MGKFALTDDGVCMKQPRTCWYKLSSFSSHVDAMWEMGKCSENESQVSWV